VPFINSNSTDTVLFVWDQVLLATWRLGSLAFVRIQDHGHCLCEGQGRIKHGPAEWNLEGELLAPDAGVGVEVVHSGGNATGREDGIKIVPIIFSSPNPTRFTHNVQHHRRP